MSDVNIKPGQVWGFGARYSDVPNILVVPLHRVHSDSFFNGNNTYEYWTCMTHYRDGRRKACIRTWFWPDGQWMLLIDA